MGDWQVLGLLATEFAGGFLALAAGVRVWNAFHLVKTPSLARLGLGFFLLSAAQGFALLLEGFLLRTPDAIERSGFDSLDLAFWLYYASLLLGLGFVFSSFGRSPFRWTPASAPLLLQAGPILQFATVVLLFFVVLHAGLHHIARQGRGSVQVAVGFFFLLLAHILNLYGYAPLEPRWIAGEVSNLLGLLILYFAVAKPRTAPNA